MKKVFLLTLLLGLSLHSVSAGVVFHIQSTDPEESPPAITQGTISVQGDRMRLEIDPESPLVFDGTLPRMLVILPAEKKYVEIDKESVDALAAKLNPMLEQLRRQMEQLPPEQRQMMEKMMGGQTPKAPTLEIRKTSQTKKIGSFDCTRYDVFSEGRPIREMWVTDWDNITGADQARPVFEEMADFFRATFQSFSMPGLEMPENPFEQLDKIQGFPVLSIELDDGKPVLETLLQSAEETPLDDALFLPPAGFTRQAMNVH